MSKDFSELGSKRASKCMSHPHIMHIKRMCTTMQYTMYANQPLLTLCAMGLSGLQVTIKLTHLHYNSCYGRERPINLAYLPLLVTIISVPRASNCRQSSLVSRTALIFEWWLDWFRAYTFGLSFSSSCSCSVCCDCWKGLMSIGSSFGLDTAII